MKQITFALLLSIFCGAAQAEKQPPAQEEIQLPFEMRKVEGAQLLAKRYAKLAELGLPGAQGKLYGQIVGLFYHIPRTAEAMPAEILSSYEAHFKNAGFTAIVKNASRTAMIDTLCTQQEKFCGHGSLQTNRGSLTPKSLEHDRFSTFRKSTPDGDIHVTVSARKVSPGNDFEWDKGESSGALAENQTFQVDDNLMLISVVLPKTTQLKLVKEDLSFMRDKLNTKGSVDLYGIYFDTNKSTLKPTSNATLSEIAKLMATETSLALAVVGHTDNVGTPAHNQQLSEFRAAAVVQALTQHHGVDAKRLTAAGKGATQPVATNDSEVNRAKNRRVELVKQSADK